jgi:hypothetical protein
MVLSTISAKCLVCAKKSGHVLKVHTGGLDGVNNCHRGWPHVSAVFARLSLASDAERLAWEAPANHVDKSAILFSGTGLYELTHVSEDWRLVKDLIFNSLCDDLL